MKVTEEPVIVQQIFDASKTMVWNAITNLDEMKKWFFENIPEFKPIVGFETQFIVENNGRKFPHVWKIKTVTPFESITYNWRYDGYKGNSFVRFELQPKHDKTELTLSHTVTENFQEGIEAFKRESCLMGWEYFIQERLVQYLKK